MPRLNNKFLFSFLIFLFHTTWALGCMCMPQESFLSTLDSNILYKKKTEQNSSTAYTPTLLIAKVKSHHGISMKLEVLENISGLSTDKKEIDVEGDNGMLCRPYASRFEDGSTWFFYISPLQKFNKGKLEDIPDAYYIASCGVYWMRVEQKENSYLIHGPITENYKSEALSVEEFKALVKTKLNP